MKRASHEFICVSVFDFVVRRLGVLKRIPLLPLVFDSFLSLATWLLNREVFRTIESIREEVTCWPHVTPALHRFGGTEFRLFGKEFGHIHGNGLLDIPFTQEIKQCLIETKQANPHHLMRSSGWVSFRIRRKSDRQGALKLLQQAYRWKINRVHLNNAS